MHVNVIGLQVVALLYVFYQHPDACYHLRGAGTPLELSIQSLEIRHCLLELQGSLSTCKKYELQLTTC